MYLSSLLFPTSTPDNVPLILGVALPVGSFAMIIVIIIIVAGIYGWRKVFCCQNHKHGGENNSGDADGKYATELG